MKDKHAHVRYIFQENYSGACSKMFVDCLLLFQKKYIIYAKVNSVGTTVHSVIMNSARMNDAS